MTERTPDPVDEGGDPACWLHRVCPDCGRLYWEGSHVRRMRAELERVIPGWGDPA